MIVIQTGLYFCWTNRDNSTDAFNNSAMLPAWKSFQSLLESIIIKIEPIVPLGNWPEWFLASIGARSWLDNIWSSTAGSFFSYSSLSLVVRLEIYWKERNDAIQYFFLYSVNSSLFLEKWNKTFFFLKVWLKGWSVFPDWEIEGEKKQVSLEKYFQTRN